jgi:hypothetical protein
MDQNTEQWTPTSKLKKDGDLIQKAVAVDAAEVGAVVIEN